MRPNSKNTYTKQLLMKKYYLVITSIFLSLNAFSQTPIVIDTSWKSGGLIAINYSQVNLSQWSAGGENSMNLNSSINLYSNFLRGKNDWQNTLDLGYAFLQTATGGVRKSDDRIEFTSKYGKKFSKNWLYSALINFKSQFAPGYLYPNDSTIISNFMAPGFLTASIGFTYKPVDYFEVLISPAAGKFTFVNSKSLSDIGAFGVDSGKMVRVEFGAYLNMKFKKDLMTNVTLTSKLELFKNYIDKDKHNDKQIDVNFNNTLDLKVNKYITASVNIQVIYDANIIERTQFKELIGVGFGYKFEKNKLQ